MLFKSKCIIFNDYMPKYIIYGDEFRSDKIIEAKDIDEATKIAKETFGDDARVQRYIKSDMDIWE